MRQQRNLIMHCKRCVRRVHIRTKKEWILLEGDQATYERLQSIKTEYSNVLSWMIPFPGNWHFLKNFQEVLIKIYFDAGLCELAKASGYQPNSIGCNFKRTHHFLLETWESLYRHFLHMFLSNQAPPDFMTYACKWIKSFPPSKDQNNTLRNLSQLLDDLTEKYPDCPSKFEIFMKEQTEKYQTWHFWSQFVFEDCFAYISQYLAMRSGQWDLTLVKN